MVPSISSVPIRRPNL